MTKTVEELNELRKEYEAVSSKLNELTQEELDQVTGGVYISGLEKIGPYSKWNTHDGIDIGTIEIKTYEPFPSPKIGNNKINDDKK